MIVSRIESFASSTGRCSLCMIADMYTTTGNNSQLGIGVVGINLAHIFYPGINVTGCGGFF